MLDALARSIAETSAASICAQAVRPGDQISDDEIGLYFWHEKGFRDHDTLVSLIDHTRKILDGSEVAAGGTVSCQPTAFPLTGRRRPRQPVPVQLALDLMA